MPTLHTDVCNDTCKSFNRGTPETCTSKECLNFLRSEGDTPSHYGITDQEAAAGRFALIGDSPDGMYGCIFHS